MARNGIKDLITYVKHRDTGLYHGAFYINHPTPSGIDRMMLWHSTKEGFNTPKEAVDTMVKAFNEEALKEIEIEEINGCG